MCVNINLRSELVSRMEEMRIAIVIFSKCLCQESVHQILSVCKDFCNQGPKLRIGMTYQGRHSR